MWLIADFEDIVTRDETETGVRRLEIIDSLTHVTFRSEYESGEAIIVVLDLSKKSSAPGKRHRHYIAPFPFRISREGVLKFLDP